MRIRWTRTAAAHLTAIADYIARENPGAAHRTIQAIRRQVEMLAEHPYSGRKGRVEGTRELVISRTPYIAAYVVEEGYIAILTVLHHARKWPDAFEESVKPHDE